MKLRAGTDFIFQVYQPTPLITVLRPRSSERQFISEDRLSLTPFIPVTEYLDSFGNLCQRMLLQPGEIRIRAEIVAEVEKDVDHNPEAEYMLIEDLPDALLQFLLPSRYCPSDTFAIRDLAWDITQGIFVGYQQVSAFREWIHRHIEYQYGVTFSSTTALDLLYNRKGVCRDFAHLGISLCRSMNIPARMVTGYLKNLKVMDLHAWFEAWLGDRWYVFDAVQENTTGGRIVIAYGRDAADVALTTQFGNAWLQSLHVWVEEI